METQELSFSDNQYLATVLPNGLVLVSGDLITKEKGNSRSYEIYFGGGRMADVDHPGACLVLQESLTAYVQQNFKPLSSNSELVVSVNTAHIRFRYIHRGKNNHDAECLERLLRAIMMDFPSQGCFRLPGDITQKCKVNQVSAFWNWFNRKVMPEWHRMHLDEWDEMQFAQRCELSQMYKVRDRWIHPANMLVLSRDRDRHGDFVHSLSQLPIGSNEARCWKPVRPCIHFKDEDYCVTSGVNTKTRRGKRALFYMPLPTERLLFFKAELALETLFGEDGFVMTKAQAKNIKMKLSIRSCYWPEPMAFVLLECAKQEWENSVALVQDASVEFGQLGEKAKRQCINHGAGRVFTKCCHPKEIAIDEWLCRKPLFARDYDRIFWKDLLVIMRAYLSESAMGYIDNVPKAKKGESLFDALT